MKLTSLLAGLLFLSGCSFVDLKNDLEKESRLVEITGTIEVTNEKEASIAIVLIREAGAHPAYVNYRIQKKAKDFIFVTRVGKYKVYAYQDLNHNQKFDPNEPIAHSAMLDLQQPGHQKSIHLRLDKAANKVLLSDIAQLKENALNQLTSSRLTLGHITSLDSASFSAENVHKGLWEPYAFIETVPFGLFFLKEYDPNKKIVLFVHGINGNPRNFTSIINNLDTAQFQALILYYPSGIALSEISKYLYSLIEELEVKLKFKRLAVVAHSMGGLISREYINLLARNQNPLVDTFISISTPWAGHASASSGVKYSPLVIPVWKDMSPDSEFLSQLFTTPLQKNTPHYLLFSFKGRDTVLSENTDGVVSLSSELHPITQEGAILVRGYDENHMSILDNKDLLTLINKLLIKNL